ncbi:MAG TPA: hypothetical protein VFC19_06225 [Candidatus Limnocylindrales bacterium]|nr:hypothetical protein [Candidatus Limnocylindrales bacterium]
MGIDSVWLYVPQVIYIRIATVAMIVVIATVLALRTRSFPLVALTILSWMGVYEIVWQIGYAAFGYQPLRPALQFSFAVFGWLILGHISGIRPDKYLTAFWALTIIAWMLLGFRANFPGTLYPGREFSIVNEILNESGKIALGFAYLLGALRSRAPRALRAEQAKLYEPASTLLPVEPAGSARA